MSQNQHELKAWYSEPVDQIRVTATPGGIAIGVDEAKELRDELDSVIREAEGA